TCESGVCGLSFAAENKPVAMQTNGDCRIRVCDGKGGQKEVTDDTDKPNDSQPCTDDVCTAGRASNPPLHADTWCGAAKVCDGNGACVDCNVSSQCSGGYQCVSHQCVPPHCSDMTKDSNETDIDCGGPECSPCSAGLHCGGNLDCA